MSLDQVPNMLDETGVLWAARAFDVDPRNLPAGYMEGKCKLAANAVRDALVAEGIAERDWDEPIHPFATTPDGEPIHNAAAIVDHTQSVVRRAHEEIQIGSAEFDEDARRDLKVAQDALSEVLDGFAPADIR